MVIIYQPGRSGCEDSCVGVGFMICKHGIVKGKGSKHRASPVLEYVTPRHIFLLKLCGIL